MHSLSPDEQSAPVALVPAAGKNITMNLDAKVHPSSQALKSLSAQLGYDFESMDGEASRLWDALNDLAAKDPSEYSSFVAKQLRHLNLDTTNKEGGAVQLNESASSVAPPFVPLCGFVVKILAFSSPAHHDDGLPVFLNICHHGSAVPRPVDEDGDAVDESHPNFERLRIPLVVSKLRHCIDNVGRKKKARAVDIVVNSWCIDTCTREPSFKSGLVALALTTLKEEHSIEIVEEAGKGQMSPWKIIECRYKGGLGDDGTDPRPFDDNRVPKNMAMLERGNIAESPSELLKCRKEQREEGPQRPEQGTALKVPHGDNTKEKSTKRMIQEIPSKSAIPKERLSIKAGFLNGRGSKIPLFSKSGGAGNTSSSSGGSSFAKPVDAATRRQPPFDRGIRDDMSMSTDIAQTLKDLSNVMSPTTIDPHPKAVSRISDIETATVNDVDHSDGVIAHSDDSSGANVSVTTTNQEVTIRVDISSCYPQPKSMDDLDLQISETCFVLAAPKCDGR